MRPGTVAPRAPPELDPNGAGVTANLRIYDGTGNVQDPGWFLDNSGSLTVRIYQTAP